MTHCLSCKRPLTVRVTNVHKPQKILTFLLQTVGEMELKDLFSKYTSKVSQNQGKMDKKLFVDCCSELLNLKSTEDPLVEQYYKLFDRDENELIDFR